MREEIHFAETSDIKYHLPIFRGPLDLLLYLIEINEIDIYDIPISLITKQYNDYLSKMKELNLFIAADFLNMASTLIYIKSQMLLPIPKNESNEIEEDPRKELVKQLIEHRKFLEVSDFLMEREEISINEFYREKPLEDENYLAGYDLNVWDLVLSLKEILKRAEDSGRKVILIEEKSITQKSEEILSFLKERKRTYFHNLISNLPSLSEIVLTFITLLELAKNGLIKIFQEAPFSPLLITLEKS